MNQLLLAVRERRVVEKFLKVRAVRLLAARRAGHRRRHRSRRGGEGGRRHARRERGRTRPKTSATPRRPRPSSPRAHLFSPLTERAAGARRLVGLGERRHRAQAARAPWERPVLGFASAGRAALSADCVVVQPDRRRRRVRRCVLRGGKRELHLGYRAVSQRARGHAVRRRRDADHRRGPGRDAGREAVAAVAFLGGAAAGLRLGAPARRRVPPILDGVLGAAGQQLGDLRPAVAPLCLRFDEDRVLVLGPAALLERRVEVVEPALAALLADAAGDAVGDLGPLGDAGLDTVDDDLVLLLGPRPLDQARLENLLPPVEALHVGSLLAQEFLRDHLPVVRADGRHRRAQLLVLFLRPAPAPPLGAECFLLLRRRPPPFLSPPSSPLCARPTLTGWPDSSTSAVMMSSASRPASKEPASSPSPGAAGSREPRAAATRRVERGRGRHSENSASDDSSLPPPPPVARARATGKRTGGGFVGARSLLGLSPALTSESLPLSSSAPSALSANRAANARCVLGEQLVHLLRVVHRLLGAVELVVNPTHPRGRRAQVHLLRHASGHRACAVRRRRTVRRAGP